MRIAGNNKSRLTMVAAAGVLVLVSSGGGAVAAKMITGQDIKDNTVTSDDIRNKSLTKQDLSMDTVQGLRGKQGPAGPAGADGFTGLEYRTYDYIAGGARPGKDGFPASYEGAGWGGIATVACSSQDKIAIAGGVQFMDLGRNAVGGPVDDTYVEDSHIVDSFPGRMNWETATPRPDRLDGWIVRLNDTPSVDLAVWGICVDK